MAIHVADENKPIDVDPQLSTITQADSVSVLAAPPEAKVLSDLQYEPTYEYTAALNGTDIRHTKTLGTFNRPGIWRVRGKGVFPGGEVEHGFWADVMVYP